MFKKIDKLIYQIRLRFSNSSQKAELFRKRFGVKIGKNVRFTGIPSWSTESYLIEIGSHVTITQNIVFHTHDGGVGLFRNEYPGMNVFGKIIIKDNVFIGSNTIIMPGVTIGNNVVIGAGSVVTKNIPSNSVAVGVPAKVIKSLEDYKQSALKKAIFVETKEPKKRKIEILSKLKQNGWL